MIEKMKLILHKIIGGRRGHSTIHIALNKKLVSDIANHKKIPIVIFLENATNCYDRIAHQIDSQLYQSFGLGIEYVLLLFRNI